MFRNRLKIAAAIANAQAIQPLRGSHGSLSGWLDARHPQPLAEWTWTFRFTGGLIVGEFLMSLGYLPGVHEPDCPMFKRIAALSPPWSALAIG